MDETEEKPTESYTVRVIVSSGNDRRIISFNDQDSEKVRNIVETVQGSFATLRSNDALLLTGSDGRIVIVNTRNVSFVEVEVVH